AQFTNGHVEGLLRPLIGRASVAKDTGSVLEGLIARPDEITQAAFLANLGEEPSTHAPTKHVDGAHRGVVIVVADRYARVGECNLGLRCVFGNVSAFFRLRAKPNGRLLSRFPVAEKALHLVAQRLPLNI